MASDRNRRKRWRQLPAALLLLAPSMVVLGVFVSPYFFLFTVFVGLNLVQSAFSGWCPMMTFLRRAGFR